MLSRPYVFGISAKANSVPFVPYLANFRTLHEADHQQTLIQVRCGPRRGYGTKDTLSACFIYSLLFIEEEEIYSSKK
jgi:hypothetical protein